MFRMGLLKKLTLKPNGVPSIFPRGTTKDNTVTAFEQSQIVQFGTDNTLSQTADPSEQTVIPLPSTALTTTPTTTRPTKKRKVEEMDDSPVMELQRQRPAFSIRARMRVSEFINSIILLDRKSVV